MAQPLFQVLGGGHLCGHSLYRATCHQLSLRGGLLPRLCAAGGILPDLRLLLLRLLGTLAIRTQSLASIGLAGMDTLTVVSLLSPQRSPRKHSTALMSLQKFMRVT